MHAKQKVKVSGSAPVVVEPYIQSHGILAQKLA